LSSQILTFQVLGKSRFPQK